jgi:hypothetical protein
MAILTYEYESDNREAKLIKFQISDELDIHEFKIICVRLASSLGYSDVSIKKSFGELDYDTLDDKFFRKIFNSIKDTKNN